MQPDHQANIDESTATEPYELDWVRNKVTELVTLRQRRRSGIYRYLALVAVAASGINLFQSDIGCVPDRAFISDTKPQFAAILLNGSFGPLVLISPI